MTQYNLFQLPAAADGSVPAEIAAMRKAGALFVVNHSGGKDSQAMYAWLAQRIPHDQIVVVHADLGDVEWDGVQDHIRATIGHELHVVRAGKTLLGMVERRHATRPSVPPWPSPKHRQCTSDLKRGPVAKFVRHYLRDHPEHRGQAVQCLGLRAQESSARAKRLPVSRRGRESAAGRTVLEWLPIQSWPIERVWREIESAGQRRHPIYDAGMTRLSCCFCIMASDADLCTAARLNPTLYQRYADLERRTGYTMRANASLPDIIAKNSDTPGALGRKC